MGAWRGKLDVAIAGPAIFEYPPVVLSRPAGSKPSCFVLDEVSVGLCQERGSLAVEI
jgi:hypothetical protein